MELKSTTPIAIQGAIDYIYDSLSDIELVENPIFDPTIDFRRAVLQTRRLYADTDPKIFAKIKKDGTFTNPRWSVLTWNRSPIQDSNIQNRNMYSFSGNESVLHDDRHKTRLVTVDLMFIIYTNTIAQCDEIEEKLFLRMSKQFAFDMALNDKFRMTISIDSFDSSGMEIIDLENMGSTSKVSFNVKISYPIFDNPQVLSLIRDVNLNIYEGDSEWQLKNHLNKQKENQE